MRLEREGVQHQGAADDRTQDQSEYLGNSTFAHFDLPTQALAILWSWSYPQTEEKSVMPVTLWSNETELPFGAAEPHAGLSSSRCPIVKE